MMHLVRHTLSGRLYRSLRFRLEERWSLPGRLRTLDEHIEAVIAWLLRAQRATPDDGVAESYNVLTKRWNPSYPETTGYIICSLLRAADAGFYVDGRLLDAARRMGAWLVSVQLPDGAFQSGNIGRRDRRPAVFNTGQILKGMTDLIDRGIQSDALCRSAERAAAWLIEHQDRDGCWRRGISVLTSEPVHAYNVRAAWALAHYGFRLNRPEAVRAALANGQWVCSVQDERDGWFSHMNFDKGVAPLTHTIAYTIQGLLELGALCEHADFIERATVAARRMVDLQDELTGAFPGQCAEGWRAMGRWTSLTGNAQMAVIGYRLARITADESWRDSATRATEFCRRLQEFDHADPGRRGALRGSYPGHVGYGRYWYMNWTQKFYLDSLLAERGVDVA